MAKHNGRGGERPDGGTRRPKGQPADATRLPKPRKDRGAATSGSSIAETKPQPTETLPEQLARLVTSIETADAAIAEDKLRIAGLTVASSLRKPRGKKRRPSLKLPGVKNPKLDFDALDALKAKLEQAVETGVPPRSLGSSMAMREIRLGLFSAMLTAFAHYADEELATFTAINSRWRLSAVDLDALDANTIHNRFRADLDRTGVLKVDGPLVAFLHGEFEASSGTFQLHFHGIATVEKTKALKSGLKSIPGYRVTVTGSAGVQAKSICDRVRQLTYSLKGYWPEKTIRIGTNGPRRDRRHRRIPEPFHSHHLLWLDRQRLNDMMLVNGCWSRRKGGSAAMREFCLFVERS